MGDPERLLPGPRQRANFRHDSRPPTPEISRYLPDGKQRAAGAAALMDRGVPPDSAKGRIHVTLLCRRASYPRIRRRPSAEHRCQAQSALSIGFSSSRSLSQSPAAAATQIRAHQRIRRRQSLRLRRRHVQRPRSRKRQSQRPQPHHRSRAQRPLIGLHRRRLRKETASGESWSPRGLARPCRQYARDRTVSWQPAGSRPRAHNAPTSGTLPSGGGRESAGRAGSKTVAGTQPSSSSFSLLMDLAHWRPSVTRAPRVVLATVLLFGAPQTNRTSIACRE